MERRDVLFYLLSAAVAALLWGALTDGVKQINLSLLAITIVLGLNLGLSFRFASIRSRLDPEHRGSQHPRTLATAATLLALVGPFVLNARNLPQWGLPGEAALLGITLLWGGYATDGRAAASTAQRALAASEQATAVAVEAGLYSGKGRVSLKDLPEAPRDLSIQVMAAYWAAHRPGRSLGFSDAEGVIAYERWQGIQEIAAGFQAARSAPQTEEGWQKVASDLVEHLAHWLPLAVEPHPAFPQPRSAFAVFRVTPVRLESVLPSPFPLLTPPSRCIEESRIKELQAILNKLDSPSRFARLVPLHPGLAVREQIAQHLGGLGRENLVVLDERDWLEILMGQDEIRGRAG